MGNVYAFSALTGGTDDSYLDYFDGNDLADGDFAFGIVSGKKYNYVLDADSAATENSPYIISPDSNAGDKRWVLVAPAGPMSHVNVYRNSVQTLAVNAANTLVFNTEEYDVLSEHDVATGIFTALQAGYYHVCAAVHISLPSSSDDIVYIYINVSGRDLRGARTIGSPGGGNYAFMVSGTVYLNAGDTVSIDVYNITGGNITTEANQAWMTIDRIA